MKKDPDGAHSLVKEKGLSYQELQYDIKAITKCTQGSKVAQSRDRNRETLRNSWSATFLKIQV